MVTKLAVQEGLLRPSVLRELDAFRSPGGRVSSYYIHLDSLQLGSHDAQRIALKDVFDAIGTRIDQLEEPAAVKHALHRDVQACREPVGDLRGLRGLRSLACFVASEAGLLRAYALPWPMRTRYFFEDRFVLWPLEQLLQQSERYGICLVDRDDARLFLYYLGRIEELEALHDEELPSPNYPDAKQELKYTKRQAEAHHKHLRRVAAELFRLSQREAFDHLILGGPEEVVPQFEAHLRRPLAQRVVARWHVEVRSPMVKEVGRRALEEEQRMLQREAAETWEAMQNVSPAGRALGPEETFTMLWQKRVRTLLLEPNVAQPGFRCGECGRLSLAAGACRECGGHTEAVEDVFTEATHDAIEQAAQVRFWPNLIEVGHIAALARF